MYAAVYYWWASLASTIDTSTSLGKLDKTVAALGSDAAPGSEVAVSLVAKYRPDDPSGTNR